VQRSATSHGRLSEAALNQAIITERPWVISRRRGRRLGPVLLISLYLHLTLLLLVAVKVHFDRPEEELPPPSTVAMVFEGGQPEGPALPHPQPNVVAPTQPPAPPPAPQAAIAPAPPIPPAAPAPPPQVAIAPPPAPQLAPVPAPLPEPPIPPHPPSRTAEETPPARPPSLAMAIPRPVPPAPRPRQPAPAAPARPDAFPTPMNFSFNRLPSRVRPPEQTSSRVAPTTLDFSLAPRQGATDNTPFSRVAGAHVGPDWRNELSAWVRNHAYYPEQAAMNGEDGDVTVQVAVNPNGRVTSVQMRSRSGSQWLDLALMGLFRDANLPALPDATEPLTFDFTMHYILIRMR